VSDLCELPCRNDGRQGKTDAPAASGEPPIRRLLRAFVIWFGSPDRHRLGSVDRMSSHMLRDIGLEREAEKRREARRSRF